MDPRNNSYAGTNGDPNKKEFYIKEKLQKCLCIIYSLENRNQTKSESAGQTFEKIEIRISQKSLISVLSPICPALYSLLKTLAPCVDL